MRSHVIRLQRVITPSATPVVVPLRAMDPDSSVTLEFNVNARSLGNDGKSWIGSAHWRRAGSATPVVVGAAILPATQATLGAAAWTITAGVTGTATIALTLTMATDVRVDIRFEPNYSVG